MNQNMVSTDDLKVLFGYKDLKSLKNFLVKKRIPFIPGNGTIMTSVDAINEKLGATKKANKPILEP